MVFQYTITFLQDRCVITTTHPDGSTTVTQEWYEQDEAAVGAEPIIQIDRPSVHVTKYNHGKGNTRYTIFIHTVGIPSLADI